MQPSLHTLANLSTRRLLSSPEKGVCAYDPRAVPRCVRRDRSLSLSLPHDEEELLGFPRRKLSLSRLLSLACLSFFSYWGVSTACFYQARARRIVFLWTFVSSAWRTNSLRSSRLPRRRSLIFFSPALTKSAGLSEPLVLSPSPSARVLCVPHASSIDL